MHVSIQDRLFPTMACFGCGPANPKGLQLKSFPDDGFVTATFRPWPEHDNGLGFLNGGIISTLLDCHSAAAVMNEAFERGWSAFGGAPLPYVTSGLNIRFLRPSPLHEPVELRAVVTEAHEPEITCSAELIFDGKPRATAEARWRRWRTR
jgi:acyl-coenzyme A thioesterase PaaI-like protein